MTCAAPALLCAAPPGCEPRHAIGQRLAESFTRDHRSATCGTVLSPSATRRRCCAATSKASERGMATQAGLATCEPKRGLAARSLRNAPGEARLPGVPRRGLGGGEGGSVGSSCWQHPPHSHWTSAPISQDCARQGAALTRGLPAPGRLASAPEGGGRADPRVKAQHCTGAACGTRAGVLGGGQRLEGRERKVERVAGGGSSSHHVGQVVDALEQ